MPEGVRPEPFAVEHPTNGCSRAAGKEEVRLPGISTDSITVRMTIQEINVAMADLESLPGTKRISASSNDMEGLDALDHRR
jgi:hypothetical protein